MNWEFLCWARVILLFVVWTVFEIMYHHADVSTSGVSEVREAWESRRKSYTSEFLEFDPCIVSCFSPSGQ